MQSPPEHVKQRRAGPPLEVRRRGAANGEIEDAAEQEIDVRDDGDFNDSSEQIIDDAPEQESDAPSEKDLGDFAAIARALEELRPAATAGVEEPSHASGRAVRWAILSTPALRDSGLSDLLLAQLSSLEGIELVEREALEAIAAEYSLSELGSASAVGHRLQLGKLLRADRLLLLARATVEDNAELESDETFQLVIADTRTGARIAHVYVPAGDDPETSARAVSVAVEQTQARFPDGLTRIVGVSHFLSKNLVHRYDHLQAGYAYLLQRALAMHPGTAVLEIEEARAIAQELSLTTPPEDADAFRHRTVPLLVDGEFEVTEDRDLGTEAVNLIVRVRHGGDVDEIRKTALPPDEAVSLLTGELPRRILALDAAQTLRFTPEQQRDWLVARAEQFGRVGAWERSLGLREAALLVAPHDVSLRLDTMQEYGLQMTRPLPVPENPDQLPSEEEIREGYRDRVDAYIARLKHLEFLIRNRELTGDEIFATELGQQWTYSCSARPLNQCIPRSFGYEDHEVAESRKTHRLYHQLADEEFRRAEAREAVFMKQTFPLIRTLECTDHDLVQRRWARHLFGYQQRKVGPGVPSGEMLDKLYQITQMFPPGSGLNIHYMHCLAEFSAEEAGNQWDRVKRGQLDWREAHEEGALLGFLNRLAQNPQPVPQLYGRWGLLKYRWWLWRERRWDEDHSSLSDTAMSQRLAQLGSLAEEAQQLLAFYESLDFAEESADRMIRKQAKQLKATLASVRRGPSRAEGEPTPDAPGEDDELAQFEFTGPVDMEVTTLTGESRPVIDDRWQSLQDRWGNAYQWSKNRNWYPIEGWRKCEEDLDVLWNKCAVLVMREKGLAEEVLWDPEARVLDVKWDRRHLWVATANDGIRVISLTGEPIRRIGSHEGLPPYDQGIVLHPIEPGTVCIAGSFGEQQRGWCAIIDLHGDRPVRVIHEAVHVRSQATNTRNIDPASWTFRPTCVYELEDEESQQRILVIGRSSGVPLVVELDTWKVKAAPRDSVASLLLAPRNIPSDLYLYIGDRRILRPSLSTGRFGLFEYAWGPSFKSKPLPRRVLCTKGGGANTLLPFGEWVYVPCRYAHRSWYRIHRETFEEQRMVRKPSGKRITRGYLPVYKLSAHYGIVVSDSVAGSHHKPYRQVLIHEPQ